MGVTQTGYAQDGGYGRISTASISQLQAQGAAPGLHSSTGRRSTGHGQQGRRSGHVSAHATPRSSYSMPVS